MGPEQRKSIRRIVRQGARMVRVDGTALGACMMIDVSATGARLTLETTDAVPNHFILLLSRDGQVHRECAVAWQSGSTVGVRFIPGCSIE